MNEPTTIERERLGADSVQRPCSALDATSMSSNGQYLAELGAAMQRGASDFAKHQGRLRASMDVVACELRDAVERWKDTAWGTTPDVPVKLRLAMQVHVNLLRDLAAELDRPGETKYAPNKQIT